MKLEKRKG